MTREIIFIGVIAILLALCTTVTASNEAVIDYQHPSNQLKLIPISSELQSKTSYIRRAHHEGLVELRSLWRHRRAEYLMRPVQTCNSSPNQRNEATEK